MDDLGSYVQTFAEAIVLLAVCIWFATLYLQYKIKSLDTELRTNVKELLDRIIFLDIEETDNRKFAYNAMTKEYVCQGADLEELNKTFGLRFPNKKGIIVEKEAGETI